MARGIAGNKFEGLEGLLEKLKMVWVDGFKYNCTNFAEIGGLPAKVVSDVVRAFPSHEHMRVDGAEANMIDLVQHFHNANEVKIDYKKIALRQEHWQGLLQIANLTKLCLQGINAAKVIALLDLVGAKIVSLSLCLDGKGRFDVDDVLERCLLLESLELHCTASSTLWTCKQQLLPQSTGRKLSTVKVVGGDVRWSLFLMLWANCDNLEEIDLDINMVDGGPGDRVFSSLNGEDLLKMKRSRGAEEARLRKLVVHDCFVTTPEVALEFFKTFPNLREFDELEVMITSRQGEYFFADNLTTRIMPSPFVPDALLDDYYAPMLAWKSFCMGRRNKGH
jgi:hypothetical protein